MSDGVETVTDILFEDYEDGIRIGATREDFEDLARAIVNALTAEDVE